MRFMRGHRPWNKGLTKETDSRVKSMIHKHSQKTRDMISRTLNGRRFSKETRDKMSVSNDRQRHSEIMKKHWQEPGYAKKVLRRRIPSYPEQVFIDLCKEFRYVGNGALVIGGKNPDFVCVSDDHKLVEIWSEHWHRGQDPQDRIKFFRDQGYECIIIKASELKCPSQVMAKVKKFIGGMAESG